MNIQDVLNGIGKWSLAILIIGTICYLTLVGKVDSSIPISIASTIIGYYFGRGKTS